MKTAVSYNLPAPILPLGHLRQIILTFMIQIVEKYPEIFEGPKNAKKLDEVMRFVKEEQSARRGTWARKKVNGLCLNFLFPSDAHISHNTERTAEA